MVFEAPQRLNQSHVLGLSQDEEKCDQLSWGLMSQSRRPLSVKRVESEKRQQQMCELKGSYSTTKRQKPQVLGLSQEWMRVEYLRL
ncbi:hypothetical protein PTKIN_Ptkin16aG0511500 [Pterospermum kingtungense]